MAEPSRRVQDVVSDVTVQALREFSTGAMENQVEGQWAQENGDDEPTHRSTGRELANQTVNANPEDDDDAVEEYEEEDDEDEDENTRVVLDPDHPLMKRFQTALNKHLTKENEKLNLQLRELEESLRMKKDSRLQIGQELYGTQQELARQQMVLEKMHDDLAQTRHIRLRQDTELEEMRDLYRTRQLTLKEEKKRGADLQGEVENLALRIFYMESAKDDVRSDIAVMKRAAEKAEAEVNRSEVDKKKQDLFVDRLVERLDKLREEIALNTAQQIAQKAQTGAARDALMEANMEIETIQTEKKQLFQQWNSSLIGMKRRDEAHSAMADALNQQKQLVLSKETEIENLKKLISKEQEKNEKLTLVLNKNDSDIMTVKKQLQQCIGKFDALKNEYATFTRMLHETESGLAKAMNDKKLRQYELNSVRKQIEKEYQMKIQLEDEILEKLRAQLTMDKAAEYTDKLTGKIRNRKQDLEQQMAETENAMAHLLMDQANCNARLERLKGIEKVQDEEFSKLNDLISSSEGAIIRRNAVIERKQGVIDQLNKKLEALIANAGGVELGPLEIQINSLQKSLEALELELAELQHMWLREQGELVRCCTDQDKLSQQVEAMKKRVTILSETKMRMESDIIKQNGEKDSSERTIRNMRNEIIKLNTLLHRHGITEEQMQKDNLLMESHFVGSLKEAEKESFEMQAKLEELKEEKERLLNSLIEAERQISLWEKKTQLAIETKTAVDSEIGQGEIRNMKAEIHRMEVRHKQLMRQQEQMMKDMEKAVSRRDTIVTSGDAQVKQNRKVLTKGTFQRQLVELRKKIKQTLHDASGCDEKIKELREYQDNLGQQLDEKRLDVQQLQTYIDSIDGDIERNMEGKHRNLSDIVMLQQKSKYYQQVKDGKYNRLFKTDSSISTEIEKQQDRMQTITAIAERMMQENPQMQPALKKVVLSYGSKMTGPREQDD